MVSEKVVKATRIAAGIVLAAFVVALVAKTFWTTPIFYPFYLALSSTMNVTSPVPVWQIAFFEGHYLWSNRIIDTMSLAVALVATGIGAAILLREEPEEEKGAEE
ncbi:MAG: hypothetical protein Q6352_010520 [Candidatus Freyrarchaeum guaymaensis]